MLVKRLQSMAYYFQSTSFRCCKTVTIIVLFQGHKIVTNGLMKFEYSL